MGIQDINRTLKDLIVEVTNSKNPYGFYEGLPLMNFSGKKIAFDISILIHQKMVTAHNEIISKMTNLTQAYDRKILQDKTFKQIISFFGGVLENGITPVVVFDGQTHHAKKATVMGRVEQKKEKSDRVDKLSLNYANTNVLDRTQSMMDEIKDAMKNMVRIKHEDYVLMKNILTSMGIVCLTAPHDAEKLCASLSLEKIVDAVYSNDTDNYPLGTSVLISKIYYSGNRGLVCDVVFMEQVMYCLSFYCGWRDQNSQMIPFGIDSLVDLCILHGCDFNVRMKIPTKKGDSLKSVGAKTALDYIKSYGRFENFPQELYPYMAPLEIGICRERFRYESSGETIESTNMNWTIFKENYLQLVEYYKLETYMIMSFSRINPRNLQLGNTCENESYQLSEQRSAEMTHEKLSIPINPETFSDELINLVPSEDSTIKGMVSSQGFCL